MFSYVFVTSKATSEIDKSLDILLKTKKADDNIIIINYNNYNIKYRSTNGVDYYHIKQSLTKAVNSTLPRNSNVVLLGNKYTIDKSFVKRLYNHFDPNSLCALRVDNISTNNRVIDSDTRIGSKITIKSFNHLALAFNTNKVIRISDTPEETAILASGWGVPLTLLPNVRVLHTNTKKRKPTSIGITILIPSLDYKYSDIIKGLSRRNDKILEFDGNNERSITRYFNKAIVESSNDCILIINPKSEIKNSDMLNRIRRLFDIDKCILFDITDNENHVPTENAWYVIPKLKCSYPNMVYPNIELLHQHLYTQNRDITTTYCEWVEKKKDRTKYNNMANNNMISIIIPFMYNGDRWPLFGATIERLYDQTKDNDNIEIIVHETAPKRHLNPSFIERFELVYLFSEWHSLFHRAWNLNVVARYLARGSTFVFFDADVLVDDDWMNELMSCDKTKYYVGWGAMKDLNVTGTNKYLKTNEITNNLSRTRKPEPHAAAAGVNIIPRDMFFNIGGWPESYKNLGYGGEDNSFAHKMINLGYYNVIKSHEHTFKSSVYHLHHSHKTGQDKQVVRTYKKHKKYTKQDWIDHIRRHYDWGHPGPYTINISEKDQYINESLIYAFSNSKKPLITVCLVSLLGSDILLERLKQYVSLGVSINMILCVNDTGSIPDTDKLSIHGICKEFSSYSIILNKSDVSLSYSKSVLLNKAKYEYTADYIIVTDDSATFKSAKQLVLGATVLDQDIFSDYGAISLDPESNTDGVTEVDDLDKFTTITIRKSVMGDKDPAIQNTAINSQAIKAKGYKLGLISGKTRDIAMDEDPRFEKIIKKYDILDSDVIKRYKNIKYPLVTMAMLSFKRYNQLIDALERHLANGTPLNIVLRVQCCEELSNRQMNSIRRLCRRFHGHIVKFTETNLGSGEPRHDVMSIALNDFDTPYIMTTDDDMMWEPNSIISQLSLFDKRPEYGVISSSCLPNYPIHILNDGKWTIDRDYKDNFVDTTLCGSATSIYRREIFKNVEYDKEYRIGLGDFDLCLQIIEAGWKIGVMNIPELKSLNDASRNPPGYGKERYNRGIIKHSISRFREKWGKYNVDQIL